jgi:hypothetical protein
MKNSVTFISASAFSSDNGAQKRQKLNLCEGLELAFFDDQDSKYSNFRWKLHWQAKRESFGMLAFVAAGSTRFLVNSKRLKSMHPCVHAS